MTTDPPPSPTPAGAPDWQALGRFVAGESGAAEAEVIAAWLRDHPDDAAVVKALDDAVRSFAGADAASTPDAEIDVEAALRRVVAVRDRPAITTTPRSNARRTTTPTIQPVVFTPLTPKWYALRVAAIVVGLAVGVVWWRQPRTGAPIREARTVATAAGQRLVTYLPDSSRVVLGPGSTLAIAAGYGAPDRSVTLSGEAMFEVRHDAAHPFTVRAGDAEIRDVGTTFVVHSDTNDVRVAVTAGAVRLRIASLAGDTGIVLRPGDRRVVEHGRDATAGATTVTSQDTAWTHGLLVFRDAPFSEVRSELLRWYGVDLQLRDSARVRDGFNAAFDGEPVDVVLKAIELANPGTRIERDGRVALVRAR